MKYIALTLFLLAQVVFWAVLLASQTIGAAVLLPAQGVQDSVVVRGGVIRLGTSVYIHDNAGHAAIGLKRVTLYNGCDARVYTDRGDEEIVAAIAEEDETLSRLQVQAGISGGNEYATIYLYRNGTHICANNRMFGSSANVWLQLTYLAD
jgi:hypothetical protein